MSEDNKTEFKILICIISGIALASFIYLIYKDLKNEEYKLSYLKNIENRYPDITEQLSQLSQPPQISIPENDNVQSILKNQEDIQTQIKDIIKLLKEPQINEKATAIKSALQPMAGTATSSKSSLQDKIRQTKFGLL